MSLLLAIYTEAAHEEVLLPAINNADFRIDLDAKKFRIPKKLSLELEILDGEWRFKKSGHYTVEKGEALFPRIDLAAALEELEAAAEAAKRAALPAIETEPLCEENVDFDTFCKSDFRVVKVKNCENVKKSDKLLKFTLDDGTGVDRQILSGIAKFYKPEELIGKTLVAIINLPPRKMMGQASCGMLISAVHTEKGEEKLNLLMVDDAIPAGAKLC